MGKSFTATTVQSLQKEIMRRANATLKKQVAPYVEDKLKQHIQSDVYETYSPIEYDRRKTNGGLMDDSNIVDNTRDGQLKVWNKAPTDPPKLQHKEYNNPDGLARLIEEGAHNPWNYKKYRWTKPRPFVTNTQADINYRHAAVNEMLKNGIEGGDSK